MKYALRFKNIADASFVILSTLMATSAFCQTVGIEGQGSSELMEFIKRIVSFVFYISITGCLLSLMIAGYKIANGSREGMDSIKNAIIGTVITAGATGILKYVVFAGSETGVQGKGDMF